MTSRTEAAANISAYELRHLTEFPETIRLQTERYFLPKQTLTVIASLVISAVSGILNTLATAMTNAAPALFLVGKSFEIITATIAVASGIWGILGLFCVVHSMIYIDDLRNVPREENPLAGLFASFKNFSQEYRREYETLREQEIGLGQTFLERNTIGWGIENDEVLGQYRCLITKEPIRHVVIDPHSGRMYERAAIVAWIERNHTSPVTTEPLTVEELLSSPETQLIIDNRLRELEEERERTTQQFILELIAIRREEDEREGNRGPDPLLSIEQRQEDPALPPRSVSPSTQQTQPSIQ